MPRRRRSASVGDPVDLGVDERRDFTRAARPARAPTRDPEAAGGAGAASGNRAPAGQAARPEDQDRANHSYRPAFLDIRELCVETLRGFRAMEPVLRLLVAFSRVMADRRYALPEADRARYLQLARLVIRQLREATRELFNGAV